MELSPTSYAFLLTAMAGLCTGIGSVLAFFTHRTNRSFLAVSMGFSAGVMLYVSMVEILPKGRLALAAAWGEKAGSWAAVLAFFGGMLLIALIDKLIPAPENPHEQHDVEEVDAYGPDRPRRRQDRDVSARMLRMGLLTALAIGIHNFPEGMATFVVALREPAMGVAIAVAIALHNIPEGIAVSIPIFYATGSRRRAFVYSLLSGVAEPVGALVGVFFIRNIGDAVFGLLFAAVSGIMVFISLDQLLPTAEKYGEHHLCTYGLLAGMAIMALSLLLFLK
jgi:ZIP family zinc transporter